MKKWEPGWNKGLKKNHFYLLDETGQIIAPFPTKKLAQAWINSQFNKEDYLNCKIVKK